MSESRNSRLINTLIHEGTPLQEILLIVTINNLFGKGLAAEQFLITALEAEIDKVNSHLQPYFKTIKNLINEWRELKPTGLHDAWVRLSHKLLAKF